MFAAGIALLGLGTACIIDDIVPCHSADDCGHGVPVCFDGVCVECAVAADCADSDACTLDACDASSL